MSKNKKNNGKQVVKSQNTAVEENVEATELTQEVEVVNAEPSKNIVVPTKKQTNVKPEKKKKEKKPNKIKSMLKETGSELKKVTWPTFPKVIKQTSIVLVVVVVFMVVLFGIDRLLSLLFDWFVSGIKG